MSETNPSAGKVDPNNARSSSDNVGKFVALISVVILAGTFIFSVIQYRSQQRDLLRHEQLDQIIKINSQMRNDSDAISQFPKNKNLTISGAEFLLTDLDGLLQSRIAVDESKSKSAQDDRRRISKILYDLVNQDCNFNEPRDVEFSIMVFDSWDDYKKYLKEDPDLVWNLLAVKYTDAVRELHDQASDYISKMEYYKEESSLKEPYSDAPRFRLFEDLIRGFERHLDLLDQRPERKELIKRFHAATCNKSLTEARFGPFEPLTDPEWFKHCK